MGVTQLTGRQVKDASIAVVDISAIGTPGATNFLRGDGVWADAQPLDADLTTIAGLTATTDNFMVAVSSAWASRTPAQVKTTLAMETANVLINSDGRIDERSQGTAATTADDAYGSSDRWYSLTQTASITVQKLTDGEDGTAFYQQLKQTQASAQRMGRAQIVESVNCKQGRGGAWTLSGRIRCSASQAIRYAILEWTGTANSVTSDVVNSWTNGTFTAGQFFNSTTLNVLGTGSITPSAATWTDITALSVTAGSSLNNLIVFFWTEGTAAQNVTLDLGKIKLEMGSSATVWRQTDLAAELVKCQRYYEVISAANGASAAYGIGQTASTTTALLTLSWKVMKRIPPALSVSAVGDWAFYDATISAFKPWTSFIGTSSSEWGGHFYVTCSGGGLPAAGGACACGPNGATTAARMYFDAEL